MAEASGEASTTTTPPAAAPPAADPPPAAAAPPAADPAPPPEPPAGRRHSLSDAQLEDRLSRARGAHVRGIGADFGVENEDQLRAILERDRAAQAAAETARTESLTREQQLTEQLATANAATAQAEEAAELAQFQALIHSTCSAMGIRNTAYAEHMVLDAAMRSTDEEFDEQAYLQTLMADPAQASALGIVATEATGATTVPGHGQDDPPPATPPPGPPGATNAMAMTKEQYATFRKGLNGGGGGNAFG